MSCYVRHMSEFLAAAGIVDNKENRKKLDLYLKTKYNLPQYANTCPEVCKIYLRPMLANEKQKTEIIGELNKIIFSKKN